MWDGLGDEGHTHTLAGVKQLASGKLLCCSGSPARRPVMPDWGGGPETPEGGDARIHLADSFQCTAETNRRL